MSRAARLVGSAVVAYCLARAATGRGAPSAPETISVVVSGCGTGLAEVRELPDRLAVELAPVRVEAGAATVLEVVTSCTAVERITLATSGAASSTTRPVSLADVAPALRAVALAVLTAEFLRSTWANGVEGGGPAPVGTASMPLVMEPPVAAPAAGAPETPAVPAPEPKPVPVPPRKASPVADGSVSGNASPRSGLRLGAAVLFRWFSRPSSVLPGGELSLDSAPWVIAANVAVANETDRLGSVGFGVAALAVGGRLPIAHTDTVAWSGVGRVEVGITWGTAASRDTSVLTGTTTGLFAALMLGPELEVSLARGLDLGIGLRGGVAHGLSITADGRPIAGTQGLAIASNVGVRYAP